jgi:hypothetical protein
MSGANFKLDGYDNIITILREMPEDGYRKPVIAAFRKAAQPVKEAMANNLPSSLSPLKKVLKISPGKGKSMTLAVGFFGRQGMYRNRRGVMWDPYMLLYWHNYGTLANRSPEHSFQNPRRKPSVNWKGGIGAGLFVERAVDQSMPEAEKIFESSYLTEHQKFLEKRAAK